MRTRDSRRLGPVVGVALLAFLIGTETGPASARSPMASVAVFPVENLSSTSIPATEVRRFLIDRFTAEGVSVLGDEALEAFMARHRVRYGGGIDAPTAEWLRQETGVDGVVIASVELSSETAPAKVALFTRIVSIAAAPVVVWTEDVGMAGDDAPGLFERGLINDYQVLLTRAFDRLGSSLTSYLRTGQTRTDLKPASKFRPKAYHRSLVLDPGRPYSVAVVPFFNLSNRRNAGEILALHFIRHLSSFPQFRVVDTGVARRQLLDARVVMDGGLSISDADTVAALIEADFVLAGRVLRYEDYDGPAGMARVEFSTALIEKKSRRVVWSSDSYNEGRDGVGLFEHGISRTAHMMATQMVRLTTELIVGRDH
jgi:TolB-like protein